MLRRGTMFSAVVLGLGMAGCDSDQFGGPMERSDPLAQLAAPRARFQVVKASGDLDAAIKEYEALIKACVQRSQMGAMRRINDKAIP